MQNRREHDDLSPVLRLEPDALTAALLCRDAERRSFWLRLRADDREELHEVTTGMSIFSVADWFIAAARDSRGVGVRAVTLNFPAAARVQTAVCEHAWIAAIPQQLGGARYTVTITYSDGAAIESGGLPPLRETLDTGGVKYAPL